VAGDVVDGLVEAVDHLDRQDRRQVFGIQSSGLAGAPAAGSCGALAAAQLDAVAA